MSSAIETERIETKIPARMDRLPWTRWHWYIVLSLGTVWILDGLEVTIKGAVGASLNEALGFSTVKIAGSASIYLFGAISGALFWGYLTDRFGRKRLFIATLVTYMVGVLGTTLAGIFEWGFITPYIWFATFRFITGFGIGGEYAAINSAIDELIPARVRGWVDLAINGSWWVGTAVGASLGFLFLQTLPLTFAWRAAFALGGLLAIGILLLRFFVPESPRWLIIHGRTEEAEETIRGIEEDVKGHADVDELEEPDDDEAIELRQRESVGFITVGRNLFSIYPRRSIAGGGILLTQAFLYNAIFFTFGLMLTTFYGVSNRIVPLFLIPFAVGNYLGPLILGRFFDTIGRKVMIPLTFLVAGVLTIATGFAFWQGWFGSAWILTAAWVVIFFFASAGASSGYLTVSETFPLEIRAMAIAFFYATATAVGGIVGPILFGNLIASGTRLAVFYGYLVGGGLMILGGVIHRIFGVEAAQRGLEDVAMPLSQKEAQEEDERGGTERDEPEAGRRAEPAVEREDEEVDEDERERERRRREREERREREREGHRPYDYRPHTSAFKPWASAPVPEDRWIAGELESLVAALKDEGPLDKDGLKRHTHARYWGPGRFNRALKVAQQEGLVRQANGRFEAAEGALEEAHERREQARR